MTASFTVPRHRARRQILRWMTRAAFRILTEFRVENSENLPDTGPLMIVANHFHFADPAVLVALLPWYTEYIAGTERPTAPLIMKKIPELWVTINVHRGGASTAALRQAAGVLEQGGLLGVFPEAGAWAPVLVRARPGAAFLAANARTRLLPVGIDGMSRIFPCLRRGQRARVTIRVGQPFGPFELTSRGRQRREALEEVGHTIMREIAALIPPEKRGLYAEDPALVQAAEAVAAYPWAKA